MLRATGDEARRGRLIDFICRAILAGVLLIFAADIATKNWRSAISLAGIGLGTTVALLLSRRGRVAAAVRVTVLVVQAGAVSLVTFGGLGLHDIAMMMLPATLVVAALLLDRRAFAWTAAGTVLAVVLMGTAEIVGVIDSPLRGFTNFGTVIDASAIVVLTAVAVGLLADSLKASLARSRMEEERFRSLVELAVDAIVLGDAEGRVIGANQRAAELTGRSVAALQGRSVESLFVPDETRHSRLPADLPSDGEARSAERRLTREDGAIVPVETSAKRMPDGTFQVFLRDLTERRRAEKERSRLEGELRQAQKMEAVGRLAGGLTHDFNNALMVIRSNVTVAQRAVPPATTPARCLAEVDQAAEKAGALVRQLLAFSRKQEIAPRRLDLGELVGGLQATLARVLGGTVRVEVVRAEEPALVEVDPVQMEHVLLNLAINAREAMPQGGRLTLEVSTAEVEDAAAAAQGIRPGPYVALCVGDSGRGMAPEVRERVFEPFFTTKENGSGLGLSMVYGAVKQNGGAIRVESEPGRGTSFRILLPRVDVPGAEARA